MEKTVEEIVKEVLANAKRGEPEIKIRDPRPSSGRTLKRTRKRDFNMVVLQLEIEEKWMDIISGNEAAVNSIILKLQAISNRVKVPRDQRIS